jgi:hypothetical protein
MCDLKSASKARKGSTCVCACAVQKAVCPSAATVGRNTDRSEKRGSDEHCSKRAPFACLFLLALLFELTSRTVEVSEKGFVGKSEKGNEGEIMPLKESTPSSFEISFHVNSVADNDCF